MPEDSNTTGHLVQISGEMGRMAAEISGLKDAVTKLQETVASQQEAATQLRMGGRIALVAISIFGGAAGGKIAHALGWLNASTH